MDDSAKNYKCLLPKIEFFRKSSTAYKLQQSYLKSTTLKKRFYLNNIEEHSNFSDEFNSAFSSPTNEIGLSLMRPLNDTL